MKTLANQAPLAERMRPEGLDDIVGQEHLVGPRGLLRDLLKRGQIPSLIFWGPPGVGKTTLAESLCRGLLGQMIHLSAVSAGVKDIREAVESAKKTLPTKTYLFLDEIHRFNKAQQDALLPHVESGLLTLLGATTENPSFSVNGPLLSRCRVITLKPLEDEELSQLVDRALTSKVGLGELGLSINDDAKKMLIQASFGDARVLLSTLEIAASLGALDAETIQKAIGRRLLLYDQSGEEHYNVVSAFIKSMRGSDPDATCHYLARMLEAGEEPRFILRRMIVFASEDVGNADPQAIQVAVSALQAFELMGMPEGYLPITQAATYLAAAPKSNAVITAYQSAKADVERYGALPIPLHLRNAPTKLMKNEGYGKGYKYPHDFPGNWVAETYLPDRLKTAKYYQPTRNGYEKFIAERLEKLKAVV